MIDLIYVEAAVSAHPRTLEILRRFPRARIVPCEHYGEVFNRGQQNFALQKQAPALILAKKNNKRVLPVPPGYGLDGADGYYFSHMLNCLYDCRYCFLQGMFRSAHYVLFVNYEDFLHDIRQLAQSSPKPLWLFSGYDCDSLALEPITGFTQAFVPVAATLDTVMLELRTKSTQIRNLVGRSAGLEANNNTVIAYSLNPAAIISAWEHRTPSLDARLKALRQLAAAGWRIALRFDPVILVADFNTVYRTFFEQVAHALGDVAIHSITLGTLRLPPAHFKRIEQLYPDEPLLAAPMSTEQGLVGYAAAERGAILSWCEDKVGRLWPNVPCYRQA